MKAFENRSKTKKSAEIAKDGPGGAACKLFCLLLGLSRARKQSEAVNELDSFPVHGQRWAVGPGSVSAVALVGASWAVDGLNSTSSA